MHPDRRAWLVALTGPAIAWPSLAIAAVHRATAAPVPLSLNIGAGDTRHIVMLVAMLTILSLAPGIVMTVTSFTRIVVALSLLRSGFGAQGVPPNPVLIALALFLSAFVMTPTFTAAWHDGIAPYNAGRIGEDRALAATVAPFRTFMLKQVRRDDLGLFEGLARARGMDVAQPATSAKEVPLAILAPAFMISELRRAFEIGFLLLVPFMVIDLAVAAVLMALGMMMLPPPTVSLPCKIIFFVLVDGWSLVAGSLIRSFV